MADETVIPWYLVIEFANLDLDDDDVLDKLVADASLHIQWSSTEGVTTAEATIAAESVPEALSLVFAVVHSAVPAAVAIGNASCRERVCQSVLILVVSVSLQKKTPS